MSRRKKVHLTMEQSKVLGEKLRAIRKSQGRTLRFIALAAGVCPAYLSYVERGGKFHPSMKRLRVIAECLEIDIDELVEEVRSGS